MFWWVNTYVLTGKVTEDEAQFFQASFFHLGPDQLHFFQHAACHFWEDLSNDLDDWGDLGSILDDDLQALLDGLLSNRGLQAGR